MAGPALRHDEPIVFDVRSSQTLIGYGVGVAELVLHARPVETVFDLLGRDENDMTAALSWALSRSSRLLRGSEAGAATITERWRFPRRLSFIDPEDKAFAPALANGSIDLREEAGSDGNAQLTTISSTGILLGPGFKDPIFSPCIPTATP